MPEQRERRKHRRMAIRLPIECVSSSEGHQVTYRTITADISSDGVCFEADGNEFRIRTPLEIELGVPPGDGHSPYAGRVRGTGRVVRVDRTNGDAAHAKYRIAAHFSKPLKLVF